MQSSVDETIANLRTVTNAKTNAELARKLGIDQSTISSWRSRGRVPNRFIQIINSPDGTVGVDNSQVWQELHERASTIALVRFTLLRRELAGSGEVDKALAQFLDLRPFWLLTHRAVHELRLKMEALGIDLKTAQALILQEDLREPSATEQRVLMQLNEDMADNPWIDGYK